MTSHFWTSCYNRLDIGQSICAFAFPFPQMEGGHGGHSGPGCREGDTVEKDLDICYFAARCIAEDDSEGIIMRVWAEVRKRQMFLG